MTLVDRRHEPLPLHPNAQAIVDAVLARGETERTVAESRRRLDQLAASMPRGPEMTSVEELSIPTGDGTIAARLYDPRPQGTGPDDVVVYFHGGGWVAGTVDQFDAFSRTFAQAVGRRLVSVGYRLAPEHPYPAAVDDALAACRWVHEHVSELPLTVLGDSAGGTLAAVSAIRARDEHGPPIALQALVYPIIGRDLDTDSYRQHGTGGLLGRSDMAWYWAHYLSGGDASGPTVTPNVADLGGLPPALLVVAEHDPLRDDGLAYGAALERAGVPVAVQYHGDMPHGFLTMIGLLEPDAASIHRAAAHVASVLGAAAPPSSHP